jgi:hypothetical protein
LAGTQVILNSNTTINGSVHTVAGNVNFDSNTLFVDSVNNRIGLNTSTPNATLSVQGTANINGPTSFANTVTITGSVAASNTVSITGQYLNVSTTAFVSNLVATSLHTTSNAELAGQLSTVSSNLVVNNANSYVNASAVTITGGTLTITSNSTVTGTTNFTGAVTIKSDFEIQVGANTNLGANTTSPQAIFAYDASSYRTTRLTALVKNGVNYQSSDMIVVHDGTTPNITVYGTVTAPATANQLAYFSTGIVGGQVIIYALQSYANSATKVVANLLK